jgi:hypothetical protein
MAAARHMAGCAASSRWRALWKAVIIAPRACQSLTDFSGVLRMDMIVE